MNRTQIAGAPLRTPAIRLAEPDDLAALRDFFDALSLRSRYQRFFAPIRPTQALLRRMCGTPGAPGQSASGSQGGPGPGASAMPDSLVALHGAVIIGHAMAADRPATGTGLATDIGVVVADSWQGRGVGSALVRALLARAADRGVAVVTMDVLHGNQQVLAMISGHWPTASMHASADYRTARVRLAKPASGDAVLSPGGIAGRTSSRRVVTRREPRSLATPRANSALIR